jgi:sugar O-acyltransferase (sialic acid O-acetyltransferase NeuD family)
MNMVIFGAGGHGKVVLDILQHDRRVNLVGFIDDDRNSHEKFVDGTPVLGDVGNLPSLIAAHQLDGAVIAVGNNKVRAALFMQVKSLGLKLENAIHPKALIAGDVIIGEGVVVASGAIINTGTKIGDNVIINTGVIIDHDNVIEDHVHISPGVKLGGKVTVKKYTHIGLGSTVAQRLTIGENATVGAGAVVLADVPENTLVVGVPARIVKRKEK